VLGVAKVPRAVERMESGDGEPGGVADIVQLRRGDEQVGIVAENA